MKRWTAIVIGIVHLLKTSIGQMAIPMTGYDKNFFAQHFEHRGSYEILAEVINNFLTQMDPSSLSVVDVGCGHGLLVESIRRLSDNKMEVYCLEGSREAAQFWPTKVKDTFYFLVDATDPAAASVLPKTDFVMSFETAEHIPNWGAELFVHLLTKYQPKAIFFSAATVNQDRGLNPSHVNEQPLSYWIDMFDLDGYKLDVALTALFRMKLLNHPRNKNASDSVLRTWWFPKNTLIFIPGNSQSLFQTGVLNFVAVDGMRRMINNVGNIMNSNDNQDFAAMWKRDWEEYESIFNKYTIESDAKAEL